MSHRLAHPFVLVILDGWGVSKVREGNAIAHANKPVMDAMFKRYPHTLLSASGLDVGLPPNQTGNSEAGHMNIGAGRVIEQDAVRVSRSINDGSFFKNEAFGKALEHVKKHHSNVHLMGLLTADQSAHADPDHLLALITFFNLSLDQHGDGAKVYLHLFTDGRDSYQYLAINLLHKFSKALTKRNYIATIIGRFYAMDRIKEWSRVEKAYDALVSGKGFRADTAEEGILNAYNRSETDEYIKPTLIRSKNGTSGRINNDDAVIFFNIRSDRVRELTKAFTQEQFDGFKRKKTLKNLCFISMVSYGPDLPSVTTAFAFKELGGTLPYAFKGLRQLYIAESEKYAHVTYFMNGGHDHPVAGEDRVIVQSPLTYTYRDKPEMNIAELTSRVVSAVKNNEYDVIVANLANPDMVAHTGDFQATKQAIEYVDAALGQIEQAVLARNGTMVVTADHGNAEEVLTVATGQINTSHSNNSVPFIILHTHIPKGLKLRRGVLADIAPTILYMLGIPKTQEMGKKTLCKFRIDQLSS